MKSNAIQIVEMMHILSWRSLLQGMGICNKCDALPSSLIDSNVSLKWKQQKGKELGHAPWLAPLWK